MDKNDQEDHEASEATRLLSTNTTPNREYPSRNINSSNTNPTTDDELNTSPTQTKQQLFNWFIKFGIVSCLILLIVTGIAVLVVYLSNNRKNIVDGCVKNYVSELDYFPEKIDDMGYGLNVQYYPHYKFSRIGSGQRYVQYQCGTPMPTGYIATRYFAVPPNNISIYDPISIPYVEMMRKRAKTVFFGNVDEIISPCSRRMLAYDMAQPFSTNETIKESQIALTDVVFSSTDSFNDQKYAVFDDENNRPEQRAAIWIQFAGIFFNEEGLSNDLAYSVVQKYTCHRDKAQARPQQQLVAWLDYSLGISGNPVWEILNSEFYMNYIIDAGATPLELRRSTFSEIQDFQAALENVTIAIDMSSDTTNFEEFQEIYKFNETSNFIFLKTSMVWKMDRRQNENGASDWYEGAQANPNAVLEDLISVINPSYNSRYERLWIRNLPANEPVTVITADSCRNTDQSYEFLGNSCSN